MTTPEFSPELLAYFASRDQQRAEDVNRALRSMSNRERNLVMEAAVMGYVRGAMAESGGCQVSIPKNSVILTDVILACRSMDDLYPVIAAATNGIRKRKGRWNA